MARKVWRSARSGVVGAVAAVILSLVVAASAAAADAGLTPDQEALARSIEGKLIAPCCWTQTVAVHDSQAAEEIKMQVRLLVAQGESEDTILDSFVQQYGEEILAAPRAQGFNVLIYLLPVIGALAAGAALLVMIPHWRRAPRTVPVVDGSARRRDDGRADLRDRLDEELSHFD